MSKLEGEKTAGSVLSHVFFSLQVAFGNFLNFKFPNALMCRVRTSSGAFLKTGHDEIVKEIENKISDFTFIPVGMWLCFLLVQNMITV